MTAQRIDLNLLRILDALFEEGSASGAARRLGMSQPALSAGLARLRTHFRDPLFVRAAAGMRPTAFALGLRAPVGEALTIVRRAVRPKAAFVPAETTRTFTLITSDIGELCFLPLLIAAFGRLAPQATLACVPLASDEVMRAMLAGEVDVAVGYFPDLAAPAIKSRFLFSHSFGGIARRDHPRIGDAPTLEEFLAESHVVVRQNSRSQELAERVVRDLGVERRVVLRSPHFMSLPLLIATTDLISIVPRAVATSFADPSRLRTFEVPLPLPEIPIAFHWARRSTSDPAVQWLIRLIDELFQGRDPTA